MTGPAPSPAPGSDTDAWQILSPLMARGGYLPWTSGSMRPSALVWVCNEIVHGERTRIVECGAGVSTVLLARLLRERGAGTVTSLEHDAHWAALISAQIEREGLGATARVVHAPLGGDPVWYQRDGSPDLTDPVDPVDAVDAVDLLIVDGPPAFDPGHEARRAPALGHFEARLVPGAVVVLDDLDRDGERNVVAGWEASSAWRFEIDDLLGIAVGRRAV